MLGRVVPSTTLLLVASELVLLSSIYIFTVYIVADIDPLVWLIYENGFIRIGFLVAGLMFGLYLQDLYSKFAVRQRFYLFQQVCLVVGLAFLFQAAIAYGQPALLLPRWIMIVGSMIVLVVLPAWRVLYSHMVTQTEKAEKILFLGANEAALAVARAIRDRPELRMNPIGLVVEEEPAGPVDGLPVLGTLDTFRAVVAAQKPDRIVVGLTERRHKLPVLDLMDLNFSGTLVEDAATTFEQVFLRVCVPQLRPSQLIFSREIGVRAWNRNLQNVYSGVLAAAGLVLAAPVMAIVGVLVKLTSSGPVLYRQERVGLNGVPFTIYKFRSMRQDAEAVTGAVWAAKDDPRITKFGKFIRRTRLDELPQLFNVIRGEMSIVGPRPERPEFVRQLSEKIPFYRQRHFVKPGVTGWAQINHKYGDTIEDTITKLEYDLYYIKNLTPALDFYILFHTIKVMLLSRGSQ